MGRIFLGVELTEREAQLCELICAGHCHKECAHQLGITYATAKQYATLAYRALGVHSDRALIARYWRATLANVIRGAIGPRELEPREPAD